MTTTTRNSCTTKIYFLDHPRAAPRFARLCRFMSERQSKPRRKLTPDMPRLEAGKPRLEPGARTVSVGACLKRSQADRLREVASLHECNQSEVIREALDLYFAKLAEQEYAHAS